ncbi:transcriptional regulator [Nitzschia inconspicua]|uniref:Transcriptional regulator n=1 Tax=Nitzschia inconspicua TaxID=303405 RepID=A0A9K3M556_9STRA|nr:transcriptional regulator [Nitzschia inconspicua]
MNQTAVVVAFLLLVVGLLTSQNSDSVVVEAFSPALFGTITRSRPTVSPVTSRQNNDASSPTKSLSSFALFMGRAAAVRAATKAKTDMKKAKTNAAFGKKLIMAVKQGGSPDPAANRGLADVIKAAKAANVPVDNINRAIKKASEASVGDFSESTFEAYGLGGASMIINVLTDNNNRASADVKSTVNRRNGKIAEQGSVLFMYDRKGKIEVPNAVLDEEALLDAAIEANIEDFVLQEGDEEGSSVVLVEPSDCAAMYDVVVGMGHEGTKMSLAWISKAPVECTEDDFDKNMEIIDSLLELDDVDSVEHNMSN